MNENQTFPFKCPTCSFTGKYKTKLSGIAADYRCPHDGSKMIWQTPQTPFVEVVQVELPNLPKEIAEFEHKLSDVVMKRLGVSGL